MHKDSLFPPNHLKVDDTFNLAGLRHGHKISSPAPRIDLREEWKDTVDPPPAIMIALKQPKTAPNDAPGLNA